VGNGFELIENFARNQRDARSPNSCADELWAQMDLNHRPHPYQKCDRIRTVRIMNDQISAVDAGQRVFGRGQWGPDEITPEQDSCREFF
jgi:hypothetical protein